MRYRELGRTGLIVSEIGFGGEWMDGTPEEARAVVDAAEAAGVNILDFEIESLSGKQARELIS